MSNDLNTITNYRESLRILKEILDKTEELKVINKKYFGEYDSNTSNTEVFLNNILDNVDKAIVNISTSFIKNTIDGIYENDGKVKLGYAFNWLTKLQNTCTDEEREEIIKNWLDEIHKKKNAAYVDMNNYVEVK